MRSSLLKISALNLSLEPASQSVLEVSGSRGRDDVGVSASVSAAAGCRSSSLWLALESMLAPFPRAELQGAQQLRHLVQLLQMICKFSIMAIHSFCHLEEPVPQNNDLKKAHSFARKSLHLGISTDAAQGCFFKYRLFQQKCCFPNTTSGTRIKLGFCQRTESCI